MAIARDQMAGANGLSMAFCRAFAPLFRIANVAIFLSHHAFKLFVSNSNFSLTFIISSHVTSPFL